MNIIGYEGLSDEEIREEVRSGARFVQYQFCASIIILTFRQPSPIYFLRSWESSVAKGIWYSVVSFVFGWWGIPFGPIYTVQSLWVNFRGGRDVTDEVLRLIPKTTDENVQVAENGLSREGPSE